ncbi:hypothetical protein POM88_033177 [Heracleum sosnowskyi]|uniref:RNase H type-1 domain-containing protein n=1 Tax=Heracleum sosnowskyi TaxID=360622 RepID=A0AAD8MLL0_9APIA|nr:hypothetical protein POM88_033177 [Heracleum sosnowskyi]
MRVFFHFVYSFIVIAAKLVDPSLTEALRIKVVLSWIKELGHQDVTVETDNLVTVQLGKFCENVESEFGLCITECRELIFTLHDVSLCYVKQSANRVAHPLARASWLNAGCGYE